MCIIKDTVRLQISVNYTFRMKVTEKKIKNINANDLHPKPLQQS
jgi:hypothetical protein